MSKMWPLNGNIWDLQPHVYKLLVMDVHELHWKMKNLQKHVCKMAHNKHGGKFTNTVKIFLMWPKSLYIVFLHTF